MKKIFFLLILSANFLTAQNWFPLELGNKWQIFSYTYAYGAYYYGIQNYIVSKDTIINGKRYFYYFSNNSNPIRYDTLEQKLYIYGANPDSNYQNAEGLYMDFNLSQNDSFWQFTPHLFPYKRRAEIFESSDTFLGRSWNIKGAISRNYPSNESKRWALNFGYYYSLPIQAQFRLDDSLLTIDHGYYPVISFTPINQISSDRFIANFSVNHYYSRWNSPGSPGSFNYIESVALFGLYEKGDSVFNITPVSAVVDRVCKFNFSLNLELLKRQYIFKYKIQAKDKGLLPHYSTCPDTGYFSLVYVDSLTYIIDNNIRPNNFSLSQNYPNPFNPSTKIKYAVSSPQYATLKVYDVLGNEVATLLDEYKPAGKFEVEFDASGLPSGVYFYRIQSGNFIDTKKMLLLK
jgi:hypothetical protein